MIIRQVTDTVMLQIIAAARPVKPGASAAGAFAIRSAESRAGTGPSVPAPDNVADQEAIA